VSIERIFYCDWRDCDAHTRTVSARPGMSFLTVTGDADRALHFCSWDCVLKYAGEIPPVELDPAVAD
jgi:hypothetical protein